MDTIHQRTPTTILVGEAKESRPPGRRMEVRLRAGRPKSSLSLSNAWMN
jgi:hypothetical protein